LTKINDNVQKLLEKRYLLRDNEGKLIEHTWSDIAMRVATSIAQAENEKDIPYYIEQFYKKINSMEFIPSSPCFTAGNKVTKSDGSMVDIEDIQVGDKVITHDRNVKSVSQIFERQTREDIYNLNVCKLLNDEFKCTGNHPIFAVKKENIRYPSGKIRREIEFKNAKPEWIFAKDLTEGDYAVVGHYNTDVTNDISVINTQELIQSRFECCEKNELIYGIIDRVTPNGVPCKSTTNKGIPKEIPLNNDMMLLFGYWLAEGSLSVERNRLRFTFHKNEIEYVEQVNQIGKTYFGLTSIIETYNNTTEVCFHSKTLVYLFESLFGHGNDKIKIPEYFMYLPYEKQKMLLVGMFRGDGCHYNNIENTDTPDRFVMALNNYNLVGQIYFLCLRLGYYCSMTKQWDKKQEKFYYKIESAPNYMKDLCVLIGKNELIERKYQCSFKNVGGYLCSPIQNITKELMDTTVYNLEVEDDHSYVVNGIAVHNCIFNAGTPSQSLSSCFVVDIEDNIEGIFQTVAECAKIFQMSGGAGFSMRKIRPRGALCNSSGSTASGVISFMNVFNEVVNRVKQGNKRNGALKIDLPCDHPEIFDFIHSKDDTTQLNNMNISVSITDEFINAVENNRDWELRFNNKVYQTVKATDLWNEIMLSAWKTAEPGLSMQGNMNRGNMNPHLHMEVFGNPCFTADMKLLTEDGYKTFGELVDKNIQLINNQGLVSEGKVWCSGIKDVVEIKTTTKASIKCTPNHVFMLVDGSSCEAKDLKNKKLMPNLNYYTKYDNEYIKYGFIQGDGCLSRINSDAHSGIEVNIGENDQDIFKLFENEDYAQNSNGGHHSYYVKNIKGRLINLGFDGSPLPERVFPITYTNWTQNQKASFIQGCYSANGSIIKKERISYKTTSKVFALQLLKALEKDFNIFGCITTNKSKLVEFSNGEYQCKESYDINISKFADIVKFHDNIGFYHDYKKQSLNELLIHRSPKINSIKSIGKEEVYDFSEPLNHWGFVEGFTVHNCMEYINIPYSSCNLASINLKKVFESEDVNWNILKENIELSFRFLDDMITVNRLPLKKIEDVTKAIRPIGLGTMGFAQLLYMLKIPYDSQKCLDFIDKLYGFIDYNALQYNIKLAKERGIYPSWKGSKWEEENLEVRCSSMTSIAPNGSIAFIANTTGGIEPEYALVYKRRDKENDEYMVADDIFEDYLKKNNMFTDVILNRINDNGGSIKGLDDIFTKESQRIFVTANDISPEWHVKVLAQIQKYVSLSISKTVNMPSNSTVEDVGNVYIMAAKSGIKGITVYRDGCRENQILSTGNSDTTEDVIEIIDRGHVIKAPSVADSRTYKFVSGCGNAYVTVTWDEKGNINQTFTNKGSSGTCKSNQEAVSRLISLSLRGGIPIENIIDQLESVDICSSYTNARTKGKPVSKGASCPHAIANILKQAVKDVKSKFENTNTKAEIKTDLASIEIINDSKSCPECKEPLINEGSCICCKSCGYSKCS